MQTATAYLRRHRGNLIRLSVVFAVPILLTFLYHFLVLGHIVDRGEWYLDSTLYRSIADNFLASGHFTQTSRPGQVGIVVPFVPPLILTVLKLIWNSDYFFVLFNFLLLGLTNVMLYQTERRLFGSQLGVSVVLYTFAVNYLPECGPTYTLTETYYLFFMVGTLWSFSLPDRHMTGKVVLMNLFAFLGFATRPLLVVYLLATLGYALWQCIRHKIAVKVMAGVVLVPLLLLAGNLWVNIRETGEPVLLENYSGHGLYVANSDVSAFTVVAGSTMDAAYYRIVEDPQMTFTQKNAKLTALARDYMASHLRKTLSYTARKFVHMYIGFWPGAFWAAAAGALLLMRADRARRWLYALFFGLMLITAITTALGLSLARYTIAAIPTYGLFIGGFLSQLWDRVAHRVRRNGRATPTEADA